MDDLSKKRSFWLLLSAIGMAVLILIGTMIYTSIEAPAPAARTSEGAPPPRGEPMRPAD